MTSCLGDIESKANDINGQVDADGYVDEFKTGYHPPEDIPFEGKYIQLNGKLLIFTMNIHTVFDRLIIIEIVVPPHYKSIRN